MNKQIPVFKPLIEKEEIDAVFKLFDSDKSGSMDVNSLKVAMSAMDFKVDSAELKKIIQEYDKEESGSI